MDRSKSLQGARHDTLPSLHIPYHQSSAYLRWNDDRKRAKGEKGTRQVFDGKWGIKANAASLSSWRYCDDN